MARVEKTMGANEFESFMRIMNIFRDVCSDIDIREGILRQRDDKKHVVTEINMAELLSNANFPISGVKSKMDLFKIFSNEEVKIVLDDERLYIGDQYSELTIIHPIIRYLNNPFMTQEELETAYQFTPEELILSIDISSAMAERIKIITSAFNVSSVQIIFDGDKAGLYAASRSTEESAKIISGIPLNIPLTKYTNLMATPFIMDHDNNIEFRIYGDPESKTSTVVWTTSIDNVEINSYSRADMLNFEETPSETSDE